MATEVFVTVKPSGQGGDYTTFAAAEAGENGDLVAADEFVIISAEGDWSSTTDTTNLIANGGVQDATRFLKFTADSANDTSGGVFDSSRYSYEAAVVAQAPDPYVIFEGLQVFGFFIAVADTFVLIDRCICSGADAIIQVQGADVTCHIRSTLLTGGDGRGIRAQSNAVVVAHSCTVTEFDFGFSQESSATVTATNCVVQDCDTRPFLGTFSGDWNVVDVATQAPGANTITDDVLFVNAAGGDWNIDSDDTTGAIDGGIDLSSDATLPVTIDLLGNTFADPPTMGAFEQITAGTIDLAGVSTGVAVAAGAIVVDITIAGASTGAAVATAGLALDITLAGASAGAAVAAGAVALDVTLAGLSAGAAVAAGAVALDVTLAGLSAGAAVAAGAFVLDVTLAGASDGAAVVAGALVLDVTLAGLSTGAAVVAGALVLDVTLAGLSTGAAVASASLVFGGQIDLAGSSAGATIAGGALAVDVTLAGASAGAAASSASMLLSVGLAGASDGLATVSGSLLMAWALAGQSAGIASASGALRSDVTLAGVSVGFATVSSTLEDLFVDVPIANFSGEVSAVEFTGEIVPVTFSGDAPA